MTHPLADSPRQVPTLDQPEARAQQLRLQGQSAPSDWSAPATPLMSDDVWARGYRLKYPVRRPGHERPLAAVADAADALVDVQRGTHTGAKPMTRTDMSYWMRGLGFITYAIALAYCATLLEVPDFWIAATAATVTGLVVSGEVIRHRVVSRGRPIVQPITIGRGNRFPRRFP